MALFRLHNLHFEILVTVFDPPALDGESFMHDKETQRQWTAIDNAYGVLG